MAHYAFLDENNIVTEVIAGRNEDEVVNGISDWEAYYGQFRGQLCKRTSYNNNIRKNYAGIGYSYDSVRDAFIPPKCHDEATLDEETCNWTCINSAHTKCHDDAIFDEETRLWVCTNSAHEAGEPNE
jgi:hypothetical protein